MNEPEPCEPVRPSMSRIGLVAYCALPPHLVFVRVPNEPGRWLLTDRCVVDVACPVCHMQAGEPCVSRPGSRRYGVGTHADRRDAAKRRFKYQPRPQHKPHLSTNDLRDARAEPV